MTTSHPVLEATLSCHDWLVGLRQQRHRLPGARERFLVTERFGGRVGRAGGSEITAPAAAAAPPPEAEFRSFGVSEFRSFG
jgi:hypothetical protein